MRELPKPSWKRRLEERPLPQRFGTGAKGAVLAVVSAFAGATLESTTRFFQTGIEPLMRSGSCLVAETFRRNTAQDRFTVVVLPFGDAAGNTQLLISEALADEYGINAIESCADIRLQAAGDRIENGARARSQVRDLISKYDADVVILGVDRGAESEIIVTGPRSVRFLFDEREKNGEAFDPSNVGAFVRSAAFFDTLVRHAEYTAESSGCLHPLYLLCRAGPEASSKQRLIDILGRLKQITALHARRSYGGEPASTGPSYFNMEVAAAAIRVHLYAYHGVSKLGDGAGAEDVLQAAVVSLGMAEIYGTQSARLVHPASTMLGRAAIALLKAEECAFIGDANEALKLFEEGLAAVHSRPNVDTQYAVAGMVGRARAAAWVQGLSDSPPLAASAKQKLISSLADIETLMAEPGFQLTRVISNDMYGPEFDSLRADLSTYLATEITEIRELARDGTPEGVRKRLPKEGRSCKGP